ncbi:MAG: pseudaminic acid synthase [Candidatus Thorarchaeota archaeon]|nr:MAG: pseudaminic acid synthase [Candidatus Thorarchaeota archaeon]
MNAITINNRKIGPGLPTYIVAEMSANHNQNFERAVKIIEAAKNAGADAVKLQTYTPDTLTINCDNEYFQIKGTIWEGKNLYDLYSEAYTPWEWQPRLKEIAGKLALDLFSSPFDSTAVDFLENMGVPAYKVASFEVVDVPLLRKIAKTEKPIIVSTGMATLSEIDEAVQTIKVAGGSEVALLKCTSAYPAPIEEMNLRTIPHLAEAFGVPSGLSDHTMGAAVPLAAVTLGACIVEKHLTLSRNEDGPDSTFSMEPHEFKEMVESIRIVEKAIGEVRYEVTGNERASRVFRRSLFVVKDIRAGEPFTEENVRSIRPGHGLHTRYLKEILGRQAINDIKSGTPLSWDLIDKTH